MKRCTHLNLVRPEWCPLVELPTAHGDLIDRDLILEYAKERKELDSDFTNLVSLDLLQQVNAVIEKE
jgi:hypothetical protein